MVVEVVEVPSPPAASPPLPLPPPPRDLGPARLSETVAMKLLGVGDERFRNFMQHTDMTFLTRGRWGEGAGRGGGREE